MPKHQDPAQLRAPCHGRGGPCVRPTVRAQLSGFARPSRQNEPAFNRAVEQVTRAAHELLASLVTNSPPRDRDIEAAKARARAAGRFGTPHT